MARIAGIDLPKNKRGVIGLTYIFGIGSTTAKQILNKAEIDFSIKVQDWNDDQLSKIRQIIGDEITARRITIRSATEYQTIDGYWM